MPGMGGCEVCRQLKANPDWKDIPVIFLSAADDKELIVRALEAGGVDYITKPFNQAELISRVRTQLALKTARDQLQQLAEDKDELLGVLAHDLKNYLGGMNLSAGLLCAANRPLPGRAPDATGGKHSAHERAVAGVRAGISGQRRSRSRLPLQPAAVNLGESAAAVVRQYAWTSLAAKNWKSSLHSRPEPVVVLADPSALDQVLDNLVSNAVKFSPPGKKVFVPVSAGSHDAECVVRDEGPGFTEDDRQRMFRRYERLSARPTGGEPSSGLGLSIVRKLVLGMNGEIVCESTAGRGARRFAVRLPRPAGKLNTHGLSNY